MSARAAEVPTARVMIVDDHINLMGDNPLIGINDDRLGPRFPDMTEAYDPKIRKIFHESAQKLNVDLKEGAEIFHHCQARCRRSKRSTIRANG